MAVATVHSQHSYKPNPLRSISLRNGKRLTHSVTTVHYVYKASSLKCRALSHAKDKKHYIRTNLKAHNLPISYTSETAEATTDDPVAIQKLLKNCLSMLRAPSSNQASSETVGQASSMEDVQTQNLTQQKGRGNIIRAVWRFIIGMDATIKITFLICVPFYLLVNSAYGPEVSKELTPLWIAGPFIVAFYVKMIRSIWALYVYCFKQAGKVVNNLPTYYALGYDYIAQGKIKEGIREHLLQPLADIKNADYRKVALSKMEDMKVILGEKYLDFTESVWPYYCRTIRFLKKANLI